MGKSETEGSQPVIENTAEKIDIVKDVEPKGPVQEFWYYFAKNKGAVAGLVVIFIFLIIE